MKCPTCGAENDPANRFCDQCGTRIDAPAAAPAVSEQPTMAAATCPNCHAPVLPGEAFCDECGAALNTTSAMPPATTTPGIASQDMPTMYAPPAPSAAPAAGGDAATICPVCGHQNLPGDRFCDNCGAALDAPAAASSAASSAVSPGVSDVPTIAAPDATLVAAPAPAPEQEAPTEETPTQPPSPVAPPEELTTPPVVSEAESAPRAPDAAAPAAPGLADQQAAYEADRRRLEDEIARQQQIIEQLEKMQTMFGPATPAAVTQGLAEARDALGRAQAEFDALQPPRPAIDPAEVARLNDAIGQQQQIIEQLEKMQTMFGPATPAAVLQGLGEARDARARLEAELSALGGAAAPTAPTAPPVPVNMPPPTPPAPLPVNVPPETIAERPPTSPGPSGAAQMDETVIAPPETSAAPPPTPPAPPKPPRLVVENNGTELALPVDRSEIVIGREDPISGIFPEVDLTPFGGEGGGVSRQHAKITRANGQWMITDLNSTNYTRVDGNKLDPNVAVPIKDGARIQLGRVVVMFHE